MITNSLEQITQNTNLTQTLVELLAGAKSQAPEVVNQLLVWNFGSSIVWGCVWAAVAYAFFCFARKVDEELGALLCYVMSIIFVCISISFFSDAAKIKTSPKLYIVEYLINAGRPSK